MKKMIIYSDPGHSWLKVHISELFKRNLINKISEYSYKRGNYVYLEEDCDMTIFIDSLKQTMNIEAIKNLFVFKHTDKSSKIRSYERFKISLLFKENMIISNL